MYATVLSILSNFISIADPFAQGIPMLSRLCESNIKNDVFVESSAIAKDPVLSPKHISADVVVFCISAHKADNITCVFVIFCTK